MVVQSVPVSLPDFNRRLLQQYLYLLKQYPIITKSVTSGILSALGNLFSQGLERRKRAKNGDPVKEIDHVGMLHYAIYGLFITGPVSHFFYQALEVLLPPSLPLCVIKRLLLDRLVFAPALLLIFFTVMTALEGKTSQDLMVKLSKSYWSALKMNWRIWTPFQFINVNFVPVQFRVLFANAVAFFWYAYLASIRK
ncbi:peroxisomal membrane protein 2 [Engraulis encrasicolus]|uniref:peroxisomal membrane protein 2 n=1 Tax=Engraulis encrasicolus TaxID=184585 RepID=UPI002FD3CF9F